MKILIFIIIIVVITIITVNKFKINNIQQASCKLFESIIIFVLNENECVWKSLEEG